MTRKEKILLGRILAALALLVFLAVSEKTGLFTVPSGKTLKLLLWLVPYLIAGYDVILEAFVNVLHGQVFDENFLMTVATFGAFFVGEYTEAAGVMIFFQTGELFQTHAVGKSRRSIRELMNIAPEYANLLSDGELTEADPSEVRPGDVIVVKPGERVPLDGTVTEGSSFLDTSSLTGESVPRQVSAGDDVISGCVNGEGTLFVSVTKTYENSTVARILELVENASSRKAPVEQFITKFAKYYTPFVTIAAVLLALLPPLLMNRDWLEWVRRACTFLVISCPCALVISIPMGFFGGIGAASKRGVLVKGSTFLESLSEVTTFVFDKTGTLTKGSYEVTSYMENVPELRELAAHAEYYSDHPAASAIRRFYDGKTDPSRVSDVRETPGEGIEATVDGRRIFLGNRRMLEKHGLTAPETDESGTVIYCFDETRFLGCFVISDEMKDNAKEALKKLRKSGVKKTVILSGDRKETAERVARSLGVDVVRAGLLPADKVSELEAIMASSESSGKTAFVGDGVNDAPVLTRADVGIAMGSLGSDAAIEAADIVLMDDDISKIPETVAIARKTLRIVRENIVFALSVKALVLLLGAFGHANMWLAVFADVGVAVLAILNAMRTLYTGKEVL